MFLEESDFDRRLEGIKLQESWLKQIMTLSTGALGIYFGFILKKDNVIIEGHMQLLISGCWIICIILALVAHQRTYALVKLFATFTYQNSKLKEVQSQMPHTQKCLVESDLRDYLYNEESDFCRLVSSNNQVVQYILDHPENKQEYKKLYSGVIGSSEDTFAAYDKLHSIVDSILKERSEALAKVDVLLKSIEKESEKLGSTILSTDGQLSMLSFVSMVFFVTGIIALSFAII